MTLTANRQLFREAVAVVAEKARAILPASVNGRIESAVKQVLWQDVEPQADGSILVGSASDPGKTYRLVGTTCECQDFTRGQAPEGWCQHRIAAGIHKRVQELLPVAPVAPEPEAVPAPAQGPQPLPEAPASANVRVTIAGREVQVTLRDHDEARLLVRLEEVLQRYPAPQPPAGPTLAGEGKDWCPIHQTALKVNHGKDGCTWLSHRTADGQWCKGRR